MKHREKERRPVTEVGTTAILGAKRRERRCNTSEDAFIVARGVIRGKQESTASPCAQPDRKSVV